MQTGRREKPLKLRRLELDLQYLDSSTQKQLPLDTFCDHFLWTLRKSPLYTLDVTLHEPFSTVFQRLRSPFRVRPELDSPRFARGQGQSGSDPSRKRRLDSLIKRTPTPPPP